MGAVRISMVELSEVSRLIPKKREFLKECEMVESAYLAGMEDVLQELATQKFLQLMGPCSTNPQIVKASEASMKVYDRLNSILNDEKRRLLGEIEEAFNFEHALLEEEWFVKGYLEGYRFIKELYKSGGGVSFAA